MGDTFHLDQLIEQKHRELERAEQRFNLDLVAVLAKEIAELEKQAADE